MEIQQTGSAVKEEIEQALESLGGYHQSYLAKLFELLDDPAAVAEWREKCLEVPFPEPPTEDYEPLLQPGMPAAHGGEGPQQGDAAPESWDEHLPSTERAIPSEQILTEPEQEMLEKLQRLPFGTWFEFRGEGEESLRLKLSWLSPLTATCMFVDRYGAQALIKTLVDSARMLASGEAKIIPKPKQQFVERAMLAIKNTLQRSMQAAD